MTYFLTLYAFWFSFIAVMGLKTRWKELPLATRILAAPGVVCAYLFDVVFNIGMSVILWDRPREATFSQRMERYKYQTDWRGNFSRVICKYLLDPMQAGGHCG